MKYSEIRLKVELDEENVPEKIFWNATDGASKGLEEAKAFNLSVWDHNYRETLRIDLWSKDMPTDDMKRFMVDSIGGMANSLRSATNDDFMNLVNEKTGSDYSWFFDVYLFNRACPQMDFSFTRNPITGNNTLKYKWSNMGNDFKIPIEIEVNGKKQIIHPGSKVQQLEVKPGTRIKLNTAYAYIARVENTGL